LLKCLSPGWKGTTQLSTKKTDIPGVRFYASMTITHTSEPLPFTVELYWTRDMGMMSLFFWPVAGFSPQVGEVRVAGLELKVTAETGAPTPTRIHITPLTPMPRNAHTDRNAYRSDHPIYELTAWAFRIRERPYIEGRVLDALPDAIATFIMHRQDREKAMGDALRHIKQNGRGWTKVYLTTQAHTLMQRVKIDKEVQYIFGLTQVFPWAPHMLDPHFKMPNCVTTDGTFEMMDPYVLEILHVIVRNESIPIAQAIFPTETKKSYKRLYAHVKLVLEQNGLDPVILANLRLVSDQGAGLCGLVRKLKLNHKLCHTHVVRGDGANTVGGTCTSNILDSSSPSECQEAAILAESKIMAFQDVEGAYERFCKPENHRILKLLLQAVEVAFQGTQWEVKLIRPEWNVPPPDSSLVIGLWAKWLRLGCPTTTNAQESVHRWLNDLKAEMANSCFWMCWEVETTYLTKRFTERNSPKRLESRTAKNWVNARAALPPKLDEIAQGRADFEEALFSANGAPVEEGEWRFPDPAEGGCPIDMDTHVFGTELVKLKEKDLPKSWKGAQGKVALSDAQALKDLGVEVPADAKAILESVVGGEGSAPSGGVPATVNRTHHRAAWRIIATIRRIVDDSDWYTLFGWTSVISTVFLVGPPPGPTDITPECEARWQLDAIKMLDIPIRV
jgi:hypothetical protein